MTKQEQARRDHLARVLVSLGFFDHEAHQLRRISLTLHRWHERECGTDAGCIERDDATGRPYWVSEWGARWCAGKRTRYLIPDRQTGALRRLSALVIARNARAADQLSAYVQTDPRGAALYILRPDDVPAGADVASYYTRGICVY